MAYEAKRRKQYNQAVDVVSQTISQIIQDLGGKESKKSNPAKGRLDANFNKKVKGEYINNRIQIQVRIESKGTAQAQVSAMAYPVSPVGDKLTFGVQGEPAKVVLDAVFTEIDAKFG